MADLRAPQTGEGYWCQACRDTGAIHCTEVWYGCDGMKVLPSEEIARRLEQQFSQDPSFKENT